MSLGSRRDRAKAIRLRNYLGQSLKDISCLGHCVSHVAVDPPPEIIDEARQLVTAAGMDVGGVEYLVDARHGGHVFYDVNALSNFVADAPAIIGFNPYANLADLIITRARAAQATVSAA